jgi:hypothetical protein
MYKKNLLECRLMEPDELEKQRRDAVDKIREHLEIVQVERRNGWKCGSSLYQRECGALVLGHLVNSVSQHRLNEKETWNQSLRSISERLKQIPDLYFPTISGVTHTGCSWVTGLHRITDACLGSIEGLKLSDFPSSYGRAARLVDLSTT